MKKLQIILDSEHKSFPAGFTQELVGDLLVFSGINGSGKTQLIDIIRGYKDNNQDNRIARLLTLDGANVELEEIAHKSFRDYSSIGELTQSVVTSRLEVRNQLWNWYTNYRLNPARNESNNYKKTARDAKDILVSKFGTAKFDEGRISQDELSNAIPGNFVLYPDDIFTNKIGEIFFNYISESHDREHDALKSGLKFDPSTLPMAPWTELNDLFKELKIDYRFRSHYERVHDVISEQPAIFATDENGAINESQRRALRDLSDGEKAIISLTFAVLASEQTHPKILLLDEYDATLNPSLTNAFFIVLKKYFIDKGTQVIVVTHSTATLSLAPDYVRFYEVYRPRQDQPRVLEVQSDAYEEMRLVNEKFYSKIEDQATRIGFIERENAAFKARQEHIATRTKPLVMTEGLIDVQYLNKAAEFYPEWKGILDRIDLEEAGGQGSLKKYWKHQGELIKFLQNQLILLFDCDTNEEDKNAGLLFKRSIPFVVEHSIDSGIENLFPDVLIDRAEQNGEQYVMRSVPNKRASTEKWKVIDSKKRELADWICANSSKEDFAEFRRVFTLLGEILG